MAKDWSNEELRRCGAIGTNLHAPFDLRGEVHPIFDEWDWDLRGGLPFGSDETPIARLLEELYQPLLLASRILEEAGLPWLSEFCVEDIFAETYPGRAPSETNLPVEDETPQVVIRHYHHDHDVQRFDHDGCKKSRPPKRVLEDTDKELRDKVARQIIWRLDGEILTVEGWVGYTCRHPLVNGRFNIHLERPEEILVADKWIEKWYPGMGRWLTVLVMREYAERLFELRNEGLCGGEEYILTAFMAAVTMLHELGHVIYWRDFRAMNSRVTEPYFGGDLEMELGDSFVSSLFGGWTPIPIENDWRGFRQRGGTFTEGLAWKQHLNWDHHKKRPEYRAHYSIRVDYVASLFTEQKWRQADDPRAMLIRPSTLPERCYQCCDVDTEVSVAGLHASAALPDFEVAESHCRWKSHPAADFRIPWYRGTVIRDEEYGDTVGHESLYKPQPPEPEVCCDNVVHAPTRVKIRQDTPETATAWLTPCGSSGYGSKYPRLKSPERPVVLVPCHRM
ncbi:hypothetical protein QBC35DRAFT_423623 [Podospora australis]|uniref:Uncharacterized protein n=1 Tax=Podospora australis TaxID=1536484 RepID=A0AAN7AL45_9PEZI|nr:hypothetical protein QBC35DRAFT_423623 [Podospora australis]